MPELPDEIARRLAGSAARFGVAIRHLETGRELMVDADSPVPLASVVKIPVMVEVFAHLEDGRFALDDRWPLDHRDKALGSGVLTALDDGLALTVRDLLTLMIVISDNTATDVLLRRVGTDAVTGRMRALGLHDIHVAHTLTEIFADMLPDPNPDQDRAELARWEAEHGVRRDGFAYRLGPDNNVGTPRELAALLELIHRGEAASRASCNAMLDILHRQQLIDRLPRLLPAGTRVAHKTGTFEGVRNDCGIITCPDGSHVVVAVLSTWDERATLGDPGAYRRHAYDIDTTIGQIALAAYQEFS